MRNMEPNQYARIAEALRVTELSLRAPSATENLDAWHTCDGHVRVAAAMHRTLGDFTGAIRLLRWFRDVSTVAGVTGITRLSDAAATTVWEWEGQEAARRNKLVRLRGDVLDAELSGNKHSVRAAYMAVAAHEEASGHLAEAAAALQTVMLHLPANDAGHGELRDRVFGLEAMADVQRNLHLPPAQRPVLDDDVFLNQAQLSRSLQ